MMSSSFPYYTAGTVVKGFGRGGKQLGIPTANLCDEAVAQLPEHYAEGVYYGWCQVVSSLSSSADEGGVHKMVMSIGKNVHFHQEKRTMEVHVLHAFSGDFYGSTVRLVMLGYLRPMASYNSLDELIFAINQDIENAKRALDSEVNILYKSDPFFATITNTNQNITNSPSKL